MMLYRADELFDDEKRDLHEELKELVSDPDRWLHEPNDQLGGKKPQNLLGTAEESRLRDLIRAIKHGIPT